MKLFVINGPNINMLGIREPNIYGECTYDCLKKKIDEWAREIGASAMCFQSNHEGDIVDIIQRCYFDKIDGIVINPAAYTHTSIAILDAIKAVSIPTVEVHISDVSDREDFRKISYVGEACIDTVCGNGIEGYKKAMGILKKCIEDKKGETK